MKHISLEIPKHKLVEPNRHLCVPPIPFFPIMCRAVGPSRHPVVVTDILPLPEAVSFPKRYVLSMAVLLAKAIDPTERGGSISTLLLKGM
ncbi:hypothetical protein JQC72_12190 [Polycladomyces sp. WAk]|uniref:Uncharacterized protein n=1 Tax=Polycladomyces zharkentensis TaxID=2807616 RepID=A0ABS2WLU3_9BACL|nr:hypothetical protein [Polycladomyces sp. WAk]MBN2910260.1 hypothetical protein [Polycladomyces sp. WAk]